MVTQSRRRAPPHPADPEGRVPNRLAYADLVLDEDRHEVCRGDQPINLSPTEFSLLRFLMRNPERVMSRAQILDHVWHYDFNGNSSVVESYISYLRRKIDVIDPPLIHTVRGVGYVLRTPRRLVRGMSIRARLIIGMVLLVSVGLVVANMAGDPAAAVLPPRAGGQPGRRIRFGVTGRTPTHAGMHLRDLCANPGDPRGLRSDFLLLVLDAERRGRVLARPRPRSTTGPDLDRLVDPGTPRHSRRSPSIGRATADGGSEPSICPSGDQTWCSRSRSPTPTPRSPGSRDSRS